MLNIGGLKIRIPIIQGGMGIGISLSGLAGAVAKEGGVGVISSAGVGLFYHNKGFSYEQSNIYGLSREIAKVREKTQGVLGVNIMVAMTNYADLATAAIKEKIDIIFSGAGLPMNLPAYLNGSKKTKLVPIISSAKAARVIAEKWKTVYDYLPDAFVVEGPKAGGHLGFKIPQINDPEFTLEKIVSQVVLEVDNIQQKYGEEIPIIAAGGIYTGTDMYNIMAKGASGVQLGTRFVTTKECDASEVFKQTYIEAEEKDIEIINSPVGMPGRAIVNNFTEKIRKGLKTPIKCPFHCIKTCQIENSPYCIVNALYNACKGNMKNGYAFAGTNAYLATKIETVKDIINEIIFDYNKLALVKIQ